MTPRQEAKLRDLIRLAIHQYNAEMEQHLVAELSGSGVDPVSARQIARRLRRHLEGPCACNWNDAPMMTLSLPRLPEGVTVGGRLSLGDYTVIAITKLDGGGVEIVAEPHEESPHA